MAFFQLNGDQIVTIAIIAAGILLVVGVLVVVALKIRHTNKDTAERKDAVDQAVAEAVEKAFAEIRKEYLVMSRNVTYTAGPQGEIAAGLYTVKCSSGNQEDFTLRYNGFVQRFHDGDTVTLGAGDTICPVSTSVLIKPVIDAPQEEQK